MPTASRLDLPRPAIIALVGVLLLAITFLITKPGDDSASVATPASAPAATHTSATTSTSATGTTSTSATTTTAAAAPKQPSVQGGPGLPRDVARALNANKVVVLFFYEPAASDDQATRAAVRAVRSAGGAANQVRLFQDVVARISDYRRITGSLGISQSPAMVVIDRDRSAQLLQGYLDAGTIRQTVRDAF